VNVNNDGHTAALMRACFSDHLMDAHADLELKNRTDGIETNAQGVVANFARDMRAIAKLAKPRRRSRSLLPSAE
jgi:hypothetical protein